jgi:hypothetical protein
MPPKLEYKMASLNGDNYQKTQNNPSEKLEIGEYAGRVRTIRESYSLAGDEAVNDEILGPSLPKGARVVDASCKVDKSTGATGIFTLGNKASTSEDGSVYSEDSASIIASADSGGQAVLAKPDASCSAMDKKFGQSETQIFATVTEILPGTVSDAKLSFLVHYVVD